VIEAAAARIAAEIIPMITDEQRAHVRAVLMPYADQQVIMREPDLKTYLSIDNGTVEWWKRHPEKGPRAFKVGRRWAWLKSDVDDWIAAQREAS